MEIQFEDNLSIIAEIAEKYLSITSEYLAFWTLTGWSRSSSYNFIWSWIDNQYFELWGYCSRFEVRRTYAIFGTWL